MAKDMLGSPRWWTRRGFIQFDMFLWGPRAIQIIGMDLLRRLRCNQIVHDNEVGRRWSIPMSSEEYPGPIGGVCL
jgi:hypothetical protein